MFIQNKCLVHFCNNNALSTFDENGNITENKNYCLDHIPDPGKAKDDIYSYILNNEKIIGLNASGLIFTDIDLSKKSFYGCDFTHCTFSNIHSTGMRARMSFFDFSIFNDCILQNSNMMFTSFSGCTLSHTLLTCSDMIQANFNGIKAFQSSFDDSDLFNSRFIQSTLVNTSFRNCNIKKTLFFDSSRTNVSFKMSNTKEAIFDKKGSALQQGIDAVEQDVNNNDKGPSL